MSYSPCFADVISTEASRHFAMRSGEIPAFRGCGYTFSTGQKNAKISPMRCAPVEMTLVEAKRDLYGGSLDEDRLYPAYDSASANNASFRSGGKKLASNEFAASSRIWSSDSSNSRCTIR